LQFSTLSFFLSKNISYYLYKREPLNIEPQNRRITKGKKIIS